MQGVVLSRANLMQPIRLLTSAKLRLYCCDMGEFYFLIVILLVYNFLNMREQHKARRVKKRRVLRPISVRPIADWFRGAWVVLKKRYKYYVRLYRRLKYSEFVIPHISFV